MGISNEEIFYRKEMDAFNQLSDVVTQLVDIKTLLERKLDLQVGVNCKLLEEVKELRAIAELTQQQYLALGGDELPVPDAARCMNLMVGMIVELRQKLEEDKENAT